VTEVTLVRDVVLLDGSTLRMRAPTASDEADIEAFYEELSEESRYLRFHGFVRPDVAARQDVEADGVDRVALVGHHEDRVVAVAGYARLREPGAAEVAFAVADDFQGRGVATRLLEQLAAIGAEQGIRRFDAEVLAGNRAMLGVFSRAGFALRRHISLGEITVSLDITPTAEVLERIDERDHIAVVASLRALLAPTSVLVMGAAATPANAGADAVGGLLAGGFAGLVTPLHSEGGVVHTLRVVTSVDQLEEQPELVVIAPDAGDPQATIEQAMAAGAKALLLLGARQHDEADADRWLELVRRGGARLVGPNSLGVINTDPAVSLHASPVHSRIVAGRLAVCSHSGAIGIGLLGHAAARRLGISAFVSLGERIDVSTNDLLEFWEEDGRTAAVMLYVETFGNPERFGRIAQRVSRRKPILAVRGLRADGATLPDAGSHTAAALQGDAAVDALLLHAGVLRFRSGEELFNAAQYFESQPLPNGRRVGIVSNSAGVATLAQDACKTRGLVVAEVGATLPPFPFADTRSEATDAASVRNPWNTEIDVAAPEYGSAVQALLHTSGIDSVLAYYVDPGRGEASAILDQLSAAAATSTKPVVASVLGPDGQLPDKSGPPDPPPGSATWPVPNFLFPEACAAVIARGAERREWLSRPLGQVPELAGLDRDQARAGIAPQLEALAEGEGTWLANSDAERLLATHGIPVTPSRSCGSVDHAVAAAAELGVPVALKASFPPPAHAADIDAVLLGLQGDAAVRTGWEELQRRVEAAGWAWQGALLQPLVSPGADILLGTVRDTALGPLIALGLGGRQASLLSTASFRLPPVTDVDADELISASQAVTGLLGGYRGQPHLDHEALRDLILRFAALVRALPEMLEADLNPVRLMPMGVTVLDMRVRIGRLTPVHRIKTW
jgi:acyl-CoA synthetase (NDP forming)/RimJ/RimL family protein N-acetyltransferase